MVLTAIGQICSTASMTHNLAQCQTLIRKAAAAGAKALFLPEASDYIASSPTESLSLCQPATISPFVLGLRSLARTHTLAINVGIHEPTDPPTDRIRNTLIWIDSDGDIVHRYAKLHVFDIDLSDTGGPKMRESDTVEPGREVVEPFVLTSSPSPSPSSSLKFGSQICFDMRFPESSLSLLRLGATAILYPSAFTVPTGRLHWFTLLRCRAIETQSWVIAAAQRGWHNEKRRSYGGSCVVDPRGVVVGELGCEDHDDDGNGGNEEAGREPEMVLVEIDPEVVERVRRGMPLKRRTDVYGVVQ